MVPTTYLSEAISSLQQAISCRSCGRTPHPTNSHTIHESNSPDDDLQGSAESTMNCYRGPLLASASCGHFFCGDCWDKSNGSKVTEDANGSNVCNFVHGEVNHSFSSIATSTAPFIKNTSLIQCCPICRSTSAICPRPILPNLSSVSKFQSNSRSKNCDKLQQEHKKCRVEVTTEACNDFMVNGESENLENVHILDRFGTLAGLLNQLMEIIPAMNHSETGRVTTDITFGCYEPKESEDGLDQENAGKEGHLTSPMDQINQGNLNQVHDGSDVHHKQRMSIPTNPCNELDFSDSMQMMNESKYKSDDGSLDPKYLYDGKKDEESDTGHCEHHIGNPTTIGSTHLQQDKCDSFNRQLKEIIPETPPQSAKKNSKKRKFITSPEIHHHEQKSQINLQVPSQIESEVPGTIVPTILSKLGTDEFDASNPSNPEHFKIEKQTEMGSTLFVSGGDERSNNTPTLAKADSNELLSASSESVSEIPCHDSHSATKSNVHGANTFDEVLDLKANTRNAGSESQEQSEVPGTLMPQFFSSDVRETCQFVEQAPIANTPSLNYDVKSMSTQIPSKLLLDQILSSASSTELLRRKDMDRDSNPHLSLVEESEVPGTCIGHFEKIQSDEKCSGHEAFDCQALKVSDKRDCEIPETQQYSNNDESEVPGTFPLCETLHRKKLECESNSYSRSFEKYDTFSNDEFPDEFESSTLMDVSSDDDLVSGCENHKQLVSHSAVAQEKGIQNSTINNVLESPDMKASPQSACIDTLRCVSTSPKVGIALKPNINQVDLDMPPKRDTEEDKLLDVQAWNLYSQTATSPLACDKGSLDLMSTDREESEFYCRERKSPQQLKRHMLVTNEKTSVTPTSVDGKATYNMIQGHHGKQLYIAYDILDSVEFRSLQTLHRQGLCQAVNGISHLPSAMLGKDYVLNSQHFYFPFPGILVTHADSRGEFNETKIGIRSYLYLKAKALGARIIDAKWLVDSQKAGILLDFDSYEMMSDVESFSLNAIGVSAVSSTTKLRNRTWELEEKQARCDTPKLVGVVIGLFYDMESNRGSDSDENCSSCVEINTRSLADLEISSLIECWGGTPKEYRPGQPVDMLLVPDSLSLGQITKELHGMLKKINGSCECSIEKNEGHELLDFFSALRSKEGGHHDNSRVPIIRAKWLENSICKGSPQILEDYCWGVLSYTLPHKDEERTHHVH